MDDDVPHISSVDDAPSPTVTNADRLAAELMELISAIIERIPELEAPHPSSAGRVRGARTVSKDAIIAMTGVVESYPELRRTFDVEAAHEMMQFNSALRPVMRALNDAATRLSYTMELKKARVAFSFLRTYKIAQALARDPEYAGLHTFLEILGREIPRGRRRRRKAADEGPAEP